MPKHELNRFFKKLNITFNGKIASEDPIIFSKTVHYLVSELTDLYKLQNSVEFIEDVSSPNTFSIELSDFLREYGFPYAGLMEGPVRERFSSIQDRIILLRFLCAELLVARKQTNTTPSAVEAENGSPDLITEDLEEHLKKACLALRMPKPQADISAEKLLSSLHKTATNALARCPSNHLGKSMLPESGLSDRQWTQVQKIANLLQNEYRNRRETLIKRVDCTIQSFKWSERAKLQLEKIAASYNPLRAAMQVSPPMDVVAQLLAARANQLLRLEKTSGSASRSYNDCPLNRLKLTGTVPDRGGRAWEFEAPPPDMPCFQKRRGGGDGGSRGSGDNKRGFGFNRGGGGSGFSKNNRGGGYQNCGGSYNAAPQSFSPIGLIFGQDTQDIHQQQFQFEPQTFAARRGRGSPRGRGGRV